MNTNRLCKKVFRKIRLDKLLNPQLTDPNADKLTILEYLKSSRRSSGWFAAMIEAAHQVHVELLRNAKPIAHFITSRIFSFIEYNKKNKWIYSSELRRTWVLCFGQCAYFLLVWILLRMQNIYNLIRACCSCLTRNCFNLISIFNPSSHNIKYFVELTRDGTHALNSTLERIWWN